MATTQAINTESRPGSRQACDLFFEEHYDEIHLWAVWFSHFDHAAADELVHDAYIGLAKSDADLGEVANLPGYVYRVLRNISRSRSRNARKHEHEDLSVLDYHASESLLDPQDAADQYECFEELEILCAFLCCRKKSSRGASLALLNFLWDFKPDEIAAITGMSPSAVNSQLSVVRKQIRTYLARPGAFRLGKETAALKKDAASTFHVPSRDPLSRLYAMIRGAHTGVCPMANGEGRLSVIAKNRALTGAELAHLVSCEACLSDSMHRLQEEPPKLVYQKPHLVTLGRGTDMIGATPGLEYEYGRVSIFAAIVALLLFLGCLPFLVFGAIVRRGKEYFHP